MIFDTPQPVYTASANGKVLYLTNGHEVEVNVSEDETEKKWQYDAAWLELGGCGAVTEMALLNAAKQGVLQEISEYDSSSAVNSFGIGGKSVWLPKDTRLGLRMNVSDAEALGGDKVTFWLSGFGSLDVKTAAAKQMLTALEVYAFECYNVTAEHKANVLALTSVEEVLGYDYTKGYPEKLNFDL